MAVYQEKSSEAAIQTTAAKTLPGEIHRHCGRSRRSRPKRMRRSAVDNREK
jgi:hypothetical protein